MTTYKEANIQRDAKLLLLERILKEVPFRRILTCQDTGGFVLQFEDETTVEFLPWIGQDPGFNIDIVAWGEERLSP